MSPRKSLCEHLVPSCSAVVWAGEPLGGGAWQGQVSHQGMGFATSSLALPLDLSLFLFCHLCSSHPNYHAFATMVNIILSSHKAKIPFPFRCFFQESYPSNGNVMNSGDIPDVSQRVEGERLRSQSCGWCVQRNRLSPSGSLRTIMT